MLLGAPSSLALNASKDGAYSSFWSPKHPESERATPEFCPFFFLVEGCHPAARVMGKSKSSYLPPPPCHRITADVVTQGLFSCLAFSSADNGVPVYSLGSAYTEVIQVLQLFLVLLPFPLLLYCIKVGDQHCIHHARGQCPRDLLNAMGGFLQNIIPFLKTLNFYLTFLTLAECSDDISLSSFQGHKSVTLGMANLGPMYG